MYDIRNEGDYKEHRLAPPKRAIVSYNDRTPGVDFNDSQVLRRHRRYGWAAYQVSASHPFTPSPCDPR